MNKTVIITGCCGFIGTNLTLHYLKNGYDVMGIDNFGGESRKYHRMNLDILKNNSGFTLFGTSINSEFIWDILKKYVSKNKPEILWNLACHASPINYRKNPEDVILSCTEGVRHICDFCMEYDIPLAHTSTSEVYGKSDNMREDAFGLVNCYGPRSCYDEGKRIAESIIYEKERKGLKAYIFRLFNTFGPYMSINDGRVIPNFMIAAIKQLYFPIFGDLYKTRSFNYIDTTINMMLEIVRQEKYGIGPLNIGTDTHCLSLYDLANLINHVSGNGDAKFVIKVNPKDDPDRRKPDLNKLSKYLIPRQYDFDFETSIRKTYEWYKEFVKQHPESIEDINTDSMNTYS